MKRHFNYQTFTTKEEAERYAMVFAGKKYAISQLEDKSGWVLAYHEWY